MQTATWGAVMGTMKGGVGHKALIMPPYDMRFMLNMTFGNDAPIIRQDTSCKTPIEA